MRKLLFALALIVGNSLPAQDTTVTWMSNADPAAFVIKYDKKNIPKEFFSVLGIDSVSEIANPREKYQVGCTSIRSLPRIRLNWIASDSSNHWILSISYGGVGSGTKFYFIDMEKGVPNSNQIYLQMRATEKTTLDVLLAEVKAKRFWWAAY